MSKLIYDDDEAFVPKDYYMTKATISTGASTQSRARRPGKRPVTLTHCSGVYEYTTDGRKILSWPMGQYGGLLGYPALDNPLTEGILSEIGLQTKIGGASLGSYAPQYEQLLADKLAALYAPYLRSPDIGIRFFSNGTDATQAAVALARHATGREAFVSVGYHGGSSPVFTFPPQDKGVLRANGEGRFDDEFGNMSLAVMEKMNEVACVVVEIPAVEDERDAADRLYNIGEFYRSDGAMFVFDDIVTSRFSPSGALKYYSDILGVDIRADFIALGKSISTYGKLSALLGPAETMESLSSEVFASYTFNDHPLGFADSLWTLSEYEKHSRDLYHESGKIHVVGNILKNGMNSLFVECGFPARVIGHPSRSAFVSDDAGLGWEFLSKLVDEYDILVHRPNFCTLAHSEDDARKTIECSREALISMGF